MAWTLTGSEGYSWVIALSDDGESRALAMQVDPESLPPNIEARRAVLAGARVAPLSLDYRTSP